MDGSKAEEEKQTPRIIRRIGEDFPLFDPECQTKEIIYRDTRIVTFHIYTTYLQIEGLTFSGGIHAAYSRGTKYDVVTPFHPEEGHVIDQRDLTPRRGKLKYRSWVKRQSGGRSF